MMAAVDHLVSIAAGRPAVAILGDMYELGAGADAFHRAVGEHCAAAGVRVVAVGELARGYLTGAAGERWFPGVDECIAALPGLAPAGSAVLVKASRLLRARAGRGGARRRRTRHGGRSPAAGSPASEDDDDA